MRSVRRRILWSVGLIAAPLILVFAIRSATDLFYFGNDVLNVRWIVSQEVRIGAPRADVEQFVRRYFDDSLWVGADHCLAARFTTMVGKRGNPRVSANRFKRFSTLTITIA
jgi:hypothetical protein